MTSDSRIGAKSSTVLSAQTSERHDPLPMQIGVGHYYQSAIGVLKRMAADPSLRAAGFVFLLTRALIFLIFIISTHITFKEPPADFGAKVHEVRVAIRRYSVPEKLRELALRGDGAWYVSIARNGYEKRPFDLEKEHNWAFFPLYPLAIRAVAGFTGNYRLTGIALSNIFFFIALILFHKLVLAFGYDELLASRAIFYTAAFPTSYFFSLPWTTSLFLLVTVGSFLAARCGAWWLAGLCAGLASATRYNGIFLFPALLIFYWQCNRPFKLRANILWLLLAPSGLLIFMSYLHAITGNAFAFADAQAVWKVHWGFFLQPLLTFIISPFELSAGWNFRMLNFAAAATALACGIAWIRRRQWAWAFYIFISVLTPLSTVTLEGHTRYMVVVFPMFVMLAIWGRSAIVDQIIRTVFLVLLALMAAFFGFYFSSALI